MAIPVNPALKPLDALVGRWKLELRFPTDPPGIGTGHAAFEWLEDGAFLLLHSAADVSGPPKGICVIGRDDATDNFTMLYFDDRGVSRIYQMSLANSEWKQWRNAPGFFQRFTGRFSADGKSIAARWEKSKDGATWEHDFDLSYTRVD